MQPCSAGWAAVQCVLVPRQWHLDVVGAWMFLPRGPCPCDAAQGHTLWQQAHKSCGRLRACNFAAACVCMKVGSCSPGPCSMGLKMGCSLAASAGMVAATYVLAP
jgi:hypothetical protein